MSYFNCDGCGRTEYGGGVKFVEFRRPRPSDPSDLCCTMAGCSDCFPGCKTPEEWEDYIESPEAYALGYLFLT